MENKSSRVENVVKNMWVGSLFQIISLILGFVSRTLFIRILGAEYLGLNSLFTNILTILSFAELGIGSAIIFNMYKPIADNDHNKLNKLVNFYKKTYFKIGSVILIVGVILIPFIPFIIEDVPDITESLILIYTLFLVDTSISYFFSYKISVITANQKNYIVIMYTYLFKIAQIIIQLVVLYFTKNYLLYLILQLVTTFITNNYLSRKAVKMYPFLKDSKNKELEKDEQKGIFSNVKALILHKAGSVVLDGTNSIIISRMFGLTILGYYSNYYLLLNALIMIVFQFVNAFTSSIGNLIANEDLEKERKVFYQLNYFNVFLFGICAICLYLLFNDFVNLWLGEKYLLSNLVVFSIVLHLYVNAVQFAPFAFRNAAGLFKQYKYASIVACFLNVGLSILLGKYIGLAGVFFATSISRLATSTIIDPIVVYKSILKDNVWKYYGKYIQYLGIIFITYVGSYYLSSLITVSNIESFIIKGIITLMSSTGIFILITFKTIEFNDVKLAIITFINKKRGRV